MKRIVVFGNSGSGKSTLAKRIAQDPAVDHLDLDTLTWETSGVRKELSESVPGFRNSTHGRGSLDADQTPVSKKRL